MTCKELFIPKIRVTLTNGNQLKQFVRLYDGKKNIYNSVYFYNNYPSSSNAIVDKIFLDFDYDDSLEFYNDVRTVAKYLYDNNILFYLRFSGRGFHIFILLDDIQLGNPKAAIRNWVKEMHDITNTKSDMSVVGDTRRVSRTLFTKNLKTKLYCIPIRYDDVMNLSYQEICDMANHNFDDMNLQYNINSLNDYLNGRVRLNISSYDSNVSKVHHSINISNVKVDNEFPPCIMNLLSNPLLGWNERRELIIYLRDDGYDYDEIISILKKTLSDEKFYHCTEEEKQVDYLLRREDILFSSCETQKLNGICGSNECNGSNLYL